MSLLTQIILFSLVGGMFSTIGGVALLAYPEKLRKAASWFLAFAAGTLLSVAFFDLLPEALESAEVAGYSVMHVVYALFGGLVGLFIVEGLLFRIHHHHDDSLITNLDHPHREEPMHTPILLTIGDSLHNFVDGIAIGAAFLAGPPVGILTTLAVVAHEVPQELSEFAVMAAAGWSRARIITINVASALLSTVGAVGVYFFRDELVSLLWLPMAITAGIFIYIAVADIMPQLYEERHRPRVLRLLSVFLLGVVVVYAFGAIIHEQELPSNEVHYVAVINQTS